MTKRNDRLQVLLSKEERNRLNKIADAQGLAPSTYARAEILKAVKRDIPIELKENSDG